MERSRVKQAKINPAFRLCGAVATAALRREQFKENSADPFQPDRWNMV
jgi:hypothetical protein